VIGRPAILLADEPTADLDAKTAGTVFQILESLQRAGTTLCTVSQDSRFAGSAQRTIHLRDGRVVKKEAANPSWFQPANQDAGGCETIEKR
jgi:putative ABC transport system ATP-binding protein